jgi:superfamily II DNA or RNA helicase
MDLRDYQADTVNQHMDAMSEGIRSTLTGLFTGAGKTVVFCEMARRVKELGGRTLILAPLRELVWQGVNKVRDIVGIDPALEMAEYHAQQDEWWSPEVIVACKQTVIRGRYKKFTDIRLLIVDEAHMQYSPTCREMFRWFNDRGAMVAGFTATPFRMDGEALTDYYERVLISRDIQWAIDSAWSVPPVCKLARVQGLDMSGVRVSGEDFNQAQLQAAVEKEANLHRIALITSEEMEGPTVVFTPSVASAKGVAHYLNNNYGITAVVVWGTQPEEERNEAILAFKSGRAQVLVNCAVVAVGFDHPLIRTLILARPTRSRSFWLQCVGRATRPLAGTVDFAGSCPDSRRAAIAKSDKPYFKIVDCTDASLDHRLVTSVDMFVVTDDREVREVVKRAAADSPVPLTQEQLEALAQAELERRSIAAEIERRRMLTRGRASGQVVGQEFHLGGGQRSPGTYMNPLKGKYAGVRMCDLPEHYIHWACENPGLRGWIKNNFLRERKRRRELTKAF